MAPPVIASCCSNCGRVMHYLVPVEELWKDFLKVACYHARSLQPLPDVQESIWGRYAYVAIEHVPGSYPYQHRVGNLGVFFCCRCGRSGQTLYRNAFEPESCNLRPRTVLKWEGLHGPVGSA